MSGKVWVNRNFLDGYPMYMNGIHKDGELVMLIFIQEVGNEQLSLYYLNLFQILCGLVETALFARTGISGGNQEQAVRAGYTYIEAGVF